MKAALTSRLQPKLWAGLNHSTICLQQGFFGSLSTVDSVPTAADGSCSGSLLAGNVSNLVIVHDPWLNHSVNLDSEHNSACHGVCRVLKDHISVQILHAQYDMNI